MVKRRKTISHNTIALKNTHIYSFHSKNVQLFQYKIINLVINCINVFRFSEQASWKVFWLPNSRFNKGLGTWLASLPHLFCMFTQSE